MECRIFYSWQKNLPSGTNRGFIQDELDAVAKALAVDEEIVVDTVVDRDTAGVAGSPDIGQTIFRKIDAAAVFVCDVSIINSKAPDKRKTPNPNVLVELGYALKSLGWPRVLMVMNTAFGPPELLPFDLKQKRAMTYELVKGASKDTARKQLRPVLTEAIKLIVKEHQAALLATAPAPPSPADAAIESIRERRPDQGPRARDFMRAFVEKLSALDPSKARYIAKDPDGRKDSLLKAIEASRPVVDEFGRVAKVAAEMDAQAAVAALVAGFEFLLAKYTFPRNHSGPADRRDYDLFKFIGHESCTILVAELMKAGNWPLIAGVVSTQLHRSDGEYGTRNVGIDYLAEQVLSLEAFSRRPGGPLSLHADVLKARHETQAPVGGVDFDEFRDADLLLFVALYDPEDAIPGMWYPRSSTHLFGRTARFLSFAETSAGARNLAAALGMTGFGAMKDRVAAAFKYLNGALNELGFPTRLRGFDASNIYTG